MPRGGKRPGAGRPKKPLAEKLATGNPGKRPIKVLEFSGEKKAQRPEPAPYLGILDGSSSEYYPSATEIFRKTVDWLETTGCLHFVSPQLIEDFALNTSRRLWAEFEVMRRGQVCRDPQREILRTNEFVKTSREYYKMASSAWDKIWKIIEQNSEKDFAMNNPGGEFLRKIYGVKILSPPKPLSNDEEGY